MNAWEAACRRCGLCCFEKSVDRRGRFVTTRIPCRHLDIVTRECRVYEKRLEVGEGCVRLTPELVAKADWLPADCAYRAIPERGEGLAPPVPVPERGERMKCATGTIKDLSDPVR